MMTMAISVAILFGVGFGGGYAARETLSWMRRAKMKKLRADKLANGVTQPASSAALSVNQPERPVHARVANA